MRLCFPYLIAAVFLFSLYLLLASVHTTILHFSLAWRFPGFNLNVH